MKLNYVFSEPFVLLAVENLNRFSYLISARFVCICKIEQLFLTVIILNLFLNQVNEQVNGEGFHIHDKLMLS